MVPWVRARAVGAWVLWTLAAWAVAQGAGTPREAVVVLTKPIAPFVLQTPDGRLTGFSIDLWNALADRLGLVTDYRLLPDLKTLLAEIRTQKGDLAIAAISITADRETYLDFSHPYFNSGLQILTLSAEAGTLQRTWGAIRRLFATGGFRSALFTLGLLLFVFAHVIWWIERERNPAFSRRYPWGL